MHLVHVYWSIPALILMTTRIGFAHIIKSLIILKSDIIEERLVKSTGMDGPRGIDMFRIMRHRVLGAVYKYSNDLARVGSRQL